MNREKRLKPYLKYMKKRDIQLFADLDHIFKISEENGNRILKITSASLKIKLICKT